MAQWLNATVVSRIDWNDHLFSLRVSCSDFPPFKAGQFTKFGLEQDGKLISRPYSLVNGPNDDELEIIAVPVAKGSLSPKLHQLQIGDPLKVMAPATGFLVLDEVPKSRDLWLMATGTGVGPFLSILASQQVWQEYENIILVYAARYEHDLAYSQLINTWSTHYASQFHFVPIVSRETKAGKLSGHIPNLLKSRCIQQQVGVDIHPAHSQIMLCGNPEMLKDATQTLIEMGLTKHLRRSSGQISLERYW
ncbi:ferredoxin--NADP reductase [Paraglaciecola aquimarina]|uniref:ferredoxin--NADP(+) reductase n=1 Tax=Paraglaciecola aquimarina TaxID=1235557 RepID=A0ABU3SZG1_9ALTE|nr:ferredoxin--NADP reductase [Paraglaciecola aquimarina]MDU0355396.1 ferredoxin--NADP reductase [Paraglaciecola aquimarina]